jgi:hypothetical protein
VLPLALELIKLEILPPGQAATSIIPKATVAVKLRDIISKKVSAGKRINWANTPVKKDLGRLSTSLKCERLMSRATPNIINARAILRVCTPVAVKLSRI